MAIDHSRRLLLSALGAGALAAGTWGAARAVPRVWNPCRASLQAHNPLLFDFVLKRHLRSGSHRFPAAVFETRGFFAPEPA